MCQREGSGLAGGYEGLDRADMEPIQVPRPPDHYAGLGIQEHGAGHIEVIADPEFDDHSEVLIEICLFIRGFVAILCVKFEHVAIGKMRTLKGVQQIEHIFYHRCYSILSLLRNAG